MIDLIELKRLAEAATPGHWKKHQGRLGGVVYGGPIQHWVRGSGQSQIAMTTGAEWMRPGENEDNAAFIAAANPAAILELLAEIERLKGGQGEAVAYVLTRDDEVCYEADDGIVISNTPGDETDLYKWKPVYFSQPAPVSVPVEIHQQLIKMRQQFERANFVNLRRLLTECLDAVAALNTTRPSHANAPADSGTHPHNDGLDDYR